MTKIFTRFLFILATTVVLACQNSQPKELAAELLLLDSLNATLTAAKSWLVLDADEIEKRYKQMEENHSYFKAHFKDTITLELAQALDQYKGIMPIYENYVKHHVAIEDEHAALVKQSENLRNSLLNGEVSKSDFKMYYAKEADDVEKVSEYIHHTHQKIIEVEPMYKRVSAVMNAKVESLRRSEKK